MFVPPKIWKDTAQPNWLTDICILSGRTDLFPQVLKELELYKQIPSKGDSPGAMYPYGLMELLMPSGWDIYKSIQVLLKRPKYKDLYAIGETLKAIINNDQLSFIEGLQHLLKSHEGIAKYGGLRESAEGFLCMPAMSLAYVAVKRDMKIEIDSNYFSLGYLKFLLENFS
jgi:hypothetical protein